MISRDFLNQRMSLPLDIKESWAMKRIKEFYNMNDGQIYIAFSGGKDSTVLLHLARRCYPELEGVFVDTGLEYPEIKDFVYKQRGITIIRPKKIFSDVIKDYGYPVISKNVSRYVSDLQNPSDKNQRTRDIRNGLTESKIGTLSKKWRFLINAPFKCSDRCCDIMKKQPFREYEKASKKHPIIGTMTTESRARALSYMKNGCINHTSNKCMPMSIWNEQDVWDYIKKYNLEYSKIYDMGEKRTGCMFCMFGIQFDAKNDENGLNRFQRMKTTHPLIHNYCMEKLGVGKVLDFINIPKE